MAATPSVSQELIEYLERTHPDASPSLSTPDRDIWFKAGQVSLVKHLRLLFDEQNQTTLSGD